MSHYPVLKVRSISESRSKSSSMQLRRSLKHTPAFRPTWLKSWTTFVRRASPRRIAPIVWSSKMETVSLCPGAPCHATEHFLWEDAGCLPATQHNCPEELCHPARARSLCCSHSTQACIRQWPSPNLVHHVVYGALCEKVADWRRRLSTQATSRQETRLRIEVQI